MIMPRVLHCCAVGIFIPLARFPFVVNNGLSQAQLRSVGEDVLGFLDLTRPDDRLLDDVSFSLVESSLYARRAPTTRVVRE